MKKIKNTTPFLLLSLFFITLSSCASHGKKLLFNNGELFYTSNITEQEATRLGKFLVDEGYFGEKEVSAKIDKTDGRYIFSIASEEGSETDPGLLQIAEQYTGVLSTNVFNGLPVDFHFCDTSFKTKKVIKFRPSPAGEEN